MAGFDRDALDRNYRTASATIFAFSDVGEAIETRDVQLITCGYPVAEFNWAFLKTPGGQCERGIERAERYFDDRKLPFRYVVRSDLATDAIDAMLAARGFVPLDRRTPGMVLDPLCAGPETPEGLEIHRVADDERLTDFQQAAFSGFGIPVQFGSAFLTADLLALPESALFVGYVDGQPAATAMLLASGPVAGIYWVATVEDHRRRGYAEALTWAALEAGLALDCRVGSLQASVMGQPVYARMGFHHSADYTNYQRPSTG